MSPTLVQSFYSLPRGLYYCPPMAAYLWLLWYQASSKLAPKHWALAVTYEVSDRAYATVYQVGFFSASHLLMIMTVPPGYW